MDNSMEESVVVPSVVPFPLDNGKDAKLFQMFTMASNVLCNGEIFPSTGAVHLYSRPLGFVHD
jgi:hypothetical protein